MKILLYSFSLSPLSLSLSSLLLFLAHACVPKGEREIFALPFSSLSSESLSLSQRNFPVARRDSLLSWHARPREGEEEENFFLLHLPLSLLASPRDGNCFRRVATARRTSLPISSFPLFLAFSLLLPSPNSSAASIFLPRHLFSLFFSLILFSSFLFSSLALTLVTEISPSLGEVRGGKFSSLSSLFLTRARTWESGALSLSLSLSLFIPLSFPSLSSLSRAPLSRDRNFFVARGISLLPFFSFLSPMRSSLLSQFSLSTLSFSLFFLLSSSLP